VRFAIVCGGGGVPRAMNAGTRERAAGRAAGRAPPAAAIEQSDAAKD